MKIYKSFIFVTAILLSGDVFAAANSNARDILNLETAKIAGATVHYDKCFKTELPAFEKSYKEFMAQKDKINAIHLKREMIIAQINAILGITDPNTTEQYRLLSSVSFSFRKFFAESKPTFYLVNKDTVKDFLRSGGQLPNFKYDRDTDTAVYRFELEMTGEKGPPEHVEITFPLGAAEKSKIKGIFQVLQDNLSDVYFMGIAIHEVVELGLVRRTNLRGRYRRWFTDGFADAITFDILKTQMREELAKEYFAENLDVNKFRDLEKEINLQYWTGLEFYIFQNNRTPVESENRLTKARYAYAAFEAQKLTGEHGIGCVKQILDELAAVESPTIKEIFEAIQKVTGEDMQKRLERYQTFATVEEGLKKYGTRFEEAAENKDYEKVLMSMLRTMELEPRHKPGNWLACADLLLSMGYEEAGEQVMRNCVSLYQNVPKGREETMEMFVIYALKCGKPRMGLEAAEELLKMNPEAVLPLTIRMLVYAEDKDIKHARQIAKKVKALAQSEGPSYKAAVQILAADPNQF